MTMRVPFVRPTMPSPDSVGAAFRNVVDSNWYTNFGPQEQVFRQGLERYVGNGVHAATVANATIGLMGALSATLPRGNGREYVAVVPFTFAAGPQAIVWHGYRPAWFDVDSDTMQPSLESFEALTETGTPLSAILLTNTFGIGNGEIARWEERASELGIPLVIDSAAGFGSTYAGGELLGARGACEVFSFHATKPFSVGEGGVVLSRDPEITTRIMQFTNFGFENREIGASHLGLNGKLSEVHAAIGNAQLERIDAILESRRQALAFYMERLQGASVSYPARLECSSVGFVSLAIDTTVRRDAIMAALRSEGVDAKTYYAPGVHHHPFFSESETLVSLQVTESLGSRMLSLPVLGDMTEAEIEYVCQAVAAHL